MEEVGRTIFVLNVPVVFRQLRQWQSDWRGELLVSDELCHLVASKGSVAQSLAYLVMIRENLF